MYFKEERCKVKRLIKSIAFVILGVILFAVPVMADSVVSSDDYGNSFAEATEIQLPINFRGSIDYPGDKDYFKFTAPTYGVLSCIGDLDKVELYDINKNKLSFRDILKLGWTYYIVVTDEEAGPYEFEFSFYHSSYIIDINGDSFREATFITVPVKSCNVFIDYSGDKDYFKFTVPYPCQISTTVDEEIKLGLYDENYNRIADNSILEPGHNYYIETFGQKLGVYHFSLELTTLDDHGNSFKEATEIQLPLTNLEGKIDYPGDEDYFKFIPTVRCYINWGISRGINTRELIASVYTYDSRGYRTFPGNIYEHGKTYYIVVKPNNEKVTGSYLLSVSFSEVPDLPLYGDVNGDQRVDSIDVVLMRNEVLGARQPDEPFNFEVADVNGDGKFNIADCVTLRDYLLGVMKTLPADKNGDGYVND